MQRSKKIANFRKNFFFARNNLKRLKIRSQHHLCSPRQISGRNLSKKKLVILQEISDPGYAKKVKKLATLEKFFFARNHLKRLKFVCNTICAVHDKFQVGISQKRSWSFFKKSVTPDMQKKSKNSNFQKKFFSLETTLNALKFVRNTICSVHNKFQAGISQKRSWSFFKKSVTPDMQKSKKIANFRKIFFFARNNLKRLKIRSQHHLFSPRQISGRYLSKR